MGLRTSAAPLLLAVALLGASCSRTGAPEDDAAFEIVKAYDQEPLHVEVKVERAKVSVADRLRVVLEATAPESFDLHLPEPTEKLGEFLVADARSAQPRLVGEGRILHRRAYVLEPFLAGRYEIPPFAVRGADKQSGVAESAAQRPGKIAEPPESQAALGELEIVTEAIAVEVVSVVPQGEPQPELKEIAEPVEMPAPWWPWIVGGIGLAALVVALLWWRRRKQLERDAIPPPAPHDVAYAELDKLMALGLLEKGEAKLFYLRLSNVLRHYIEDRFGLRAPEQTTEEFLAELQRGQPFAPKHNESLQAFLEHCDLVKFAELQPTPEEAETSVDLCRKFIGETKQEELSALETVGVS
jgi:hypothetical protein